MKYTINDILAMKPCPHYTRKRITDLFGGKTHVSVHDAVAAEIPKEDKVWILGHMLPWPKDFVFPEGVTYLEVCNNPALTELVVPEGVTYLDVENNPALTKLILPEDVTYLWVGNNGEG